MSRQPLVDKVISAMKRHEMLSHGDKVLIGLSGGPDSVCLLHILASLRKRFNLSLHALYIDHRLRPDEAESEIAFCRALCEKNDIPFLAKSIEVRSHAATMKLNLQEAARQLRYWTYEEIAHEIGAQRIALGHTADDQAETILIHLLRGAGPTGLAGIPPVRKNIIRPLIEIERKEIEQYLHSAGISFIVDSSNLKKNYVRNRIRLSVLPMIREFNPDITGILARTAAIFREEERYFQILVTKTLMKMISRKTETRIELFLAPFEIMDTVIMRRVLRRAIDETNSLRGIAFSHIEDIIELIKNGSPGDRLYLPRGIRVIKDYAKLVITSEAPAKLNACTLNVPGDTILSEAGIIIKASVTEKAKMEEAPPMEKLLAVFDADKVQVPLTVRPRKPGDVFYPFGFGRRKKIQDFFVDEKVPRDERDRIPLIVSGNDIVWVVGYRADDRVKVTEETNRIIMLEAKKMRD